jgi:hypothetical protein
MRYPPASAPGKSYRQVVLSDPKTIAHLFFKDITTYHQPAVEREAPAFFQAFSHISFEFGDHLVTVALRGDSQEIGRSFLLRAVFLDCLNLGRLFVYLLDQNVHINHKQRFSNLKPQLVIPLVFSATFTLTNIRGFSEDFSRLHGLWQQKMTLHTQSHPPL